MKGLIRTINLFLNYKLYKSVVYTICLCILYRVNIIRDTVIPIKCFLNLDSLSRKVAHIMLVFMIF